MVDSPTPLVDESAAFDTSDVSILDRIWDELGIAQGYIEVVATEKHLAGKHDQQSHAGSSAASEPYNLPLQSAEKSLQAETRYRDNLKNLRGAVKLASQLGYEDTDEMLRTVVEDAQQMFSGADVYMNVPNGVLSKILTQGFANQHKTQTSSGLLDNRRRDKVERDLFAIPEGASPEEHPIYGYISNDNSLKNLSFAKAYGKVTIKFKQDIKERTTFTAEDSFDYSQGTGAIPAPFGKPRLAAILGCDVARLARPKKKSPSVDETLSKPYTYWEAQIHGQATYKDIDKIIFASAPKSKMIQLLLELGIPYEVT